LEAVPHLADHGVVGVVKLGAERGRIDPGSGVEAAACGWYQGASDLRRQDVLVPVVLRERVGQPVLGKAVAVYRCGVERTDPCGPGGIDQSLGIDRINWSEEVPDGYASP
jgi:hypothetical protein